MVLDHASIYLFGTTTRIDTTTNKSIIIILSFPHIIRPVMVLPPDIHARLSKVHNSKVGHWGLDICKRRLREAHQPFSYL